VKTILLLGASADQVFAIRTAKAMGLRALTVDQNPGSPGFELADEYAVVSTRDVRALVAFLDERRRTGGRVDGVLVMGSDIPEVVVALCEHLGTPHIPMEAAVLSTNKYDMKCRFVERGVPVPWFSRVSHADELREIVREHHHPLIIKPLDRSGARGVLRLSDGCNVDALFAKAAAAAFSGQVMVEEFLTGLQLSTETVMHEGRAFTPGLADRNYEYLDRFAPHVIENGGTVPTSIGDAERAGVEALVEKAALALGVADGVVKGDVVLTERGPVMIEMATRLSGGDFSESLVPLSSGVNYVEAAIRIALGETPDIGALKPKWAQAVINRYFFPRPGTLVRIEGAEEVRRWPWVKKLEFWYRPGDVVPEIRSHADRFGVAIVVGQSAQEAEQRAQQVFETIRIVVDDTRGTHGVP